MKQKTSKKIHGEIQIKLLNNKYKKNYMDFLFKVNNSNIYYTLEWKESLQRCFDFKPQYLIVKDDSDVIYAALPLFLLKNIYGKRLGSLPFSSYGGVLGEKKYEKLLILESLNLMNQLNCEFVTIRQNPLIDFFKKDNVIIYKNRLRQYLKIIKPEILWKKIKKSNREHIRKANKVGVKIEKAVDKNGLEEFYLLSLLTSKRKGIFSPPLIFFKTIWDILYPKGYVEIFLAKYNNETIAATLNFSFNDTVVSAFGPWNPVYKRYFPNNLLDWESINWCYKNNFSIYDLGTTGINNPGLISYKDSFGALKIPYFFYSFQKRFPPFDLSYSQAGKKFVQKIPKPFFNIFNDWMSKKTA
jgi:predicted N-acyltransferase